VNYLQLVQRLHRESLRSGAAPGAIVGATKDALRLFDWVDDAWSELQNFTWWSWQRTRKAAAALTPGVSSYTPTDLGITDFRAWWPVGPEYTPTVAPVAAPANVSVLQWVPYDTFRRDFLATPVQAGSPQYWTAGPDNILLIAPAPDQAFTLDIDYRTENTVLTAESDTPVLPERHHMILVWRALQEQGATDAAPEVFARAKSNLDRMRSDLVVECGPRMTIERRRLA